MPKIMTTAPPMMLNRWDLEENTFPTPFTPNERMKKVTEIPRTKKSVFITTLLLLYIISPFSSLSAFPPERKEKYTGRRGSTQGEKNESTPSRKEAKAEISLTKEKFIFYPFRKTGAFSPGRNYSSNPLGLFFCQFQESRHISTRLYFAFQPSSLSAFAGSE